jgi:hypothetical protein
MRPVERKILAVLAEEDEPMPWTSIFNGVCPWPAVELFDAAIDLRYMGLIAVTGEDGPESYVITEAGRAALDAAIRNAED